MNDEKSSVNLLGIIAVVIIVGCLGAIAIALTVKAVEALF